MYNKLKKLNIILFVVIIVVSLGGCSWLDYFSKKPVPKSTPEGLYARASSEYKNGNYKKAREYFLRVKEEHPLHEMAVLAEIGVADSFYSDKEYASAIDAYSDFISLHPVNENVPYAIFQMGMCHYHEMEAIDRDQTETIKAKKEWEKLIARYPDSKFAPMAEKMLREVKQRLAKRELYIAEFYLRQKKYYAALSRFETIAREYSGLGFDHKVESYIKETKAKIDEEEKQYLKEAEEKKKKEEQKLKKEEEKKKKSSKN